MGLTADQIVAMMKDYDDNKLTVQEIADKYGVDPGTVTNIRKRLGLPLRIPKQRIDPAELEKARRRLARKKR